MEWGLLRPPQQSPAVCFLCHCVFVSIGMKLQFRNILMKASITWCDLFWPKFAKKMPKIISLHDVLEPLKQALLASRDVNISSQICGSKLQKVFTLGDGCWLPTIYWFTYPICTFWFLGQSWYLMQSEPKWSLTKAEVPPPAECSKIESFSGLKGLKFPQTRKSGLRGRSANRMWGESCNFGLANLRRFAGEFLSKLLAKFSALLLQGFRPPKKPRPKFASNCRRSSPISDLWAQFFVHADFLPTGKHQDLGDLGPAKCGENHTSSSSCCRVACLAPCKRLQCSSLHQASPEASPVLEEGERPPPPHFRP